MIKTLNKLNIEKHTPTILEASYDNPTAHILLKFEKLKAFLLILGIKQGWPHSPLLFNVLLEALAKTITQEIEMKDIQIGVEEIKLSLFADDMILEKTQDSIKKTVRTSKCNLTVYKINIQKSVIFIY